MAKILCSKSGITFRCEHFPIYLDRGESTHPIFSVPLKRLWKFFPKWQAGELTNTDSYLYFLALLNATELVEFRTPVLITQTTESIVASNMEELFATISKIITVKHPKFVIPSFVISQDTRTLSNVKYWIETWNHSYTDFMKGLKDEDIRTRAQRRENALERLIKNPALHPQKYARILASWASDAAAFPTYEIYDPFGNETTVSEYWQDIITKCYTAESIISIPLKDISALLEHCEQNLDLGSIQSYHLFNTIREGITTVNGFFSIGSTHFRMLSDNAESKDVGDANLQLIIDSAPIKEPVRTDYPTEFAYIKDKMKWKLAKNQEAAK